MNDLEAMAERLFPNNVSHRAKWLQAVANLRAGRGWCRDGVIGYKLQAESEPPKADRVLPVVKLRAAK